ncbi:MAG: acyl-CoA desaturase [Patescibacteria group bacterium]
MDSVNKAFIDLERRVRAQGLLDPTPAFYVYTVGMALALVVASVVILVTVKNSWIHMLNAVLLAFAFGQLTLFSHDVGHGQVTGSRWHALMSNWFGVMLGWNLDWWVYKHNRHHAFPNQPGYDPDIGIKFIAFSEDQARARTGWYRVMARYQNFLFIPMLFGESWHLRCASIAYLSHQRILKFALGIALITLHLALYLGVIFYFLSIWQALSFVVIHWGLLGVYLGLIFAPNHKGMPIIEHGTVPGYLEQQVLTARNVRGGYLVDIVYGGLNYQIEHHLFPSMPRWHLRQVAPMVEALCREKNLPYTKTNVRESFREIFGHLSHVGKAAAAEN